MRSCISPGPMGFGGLPRWVDFWWEPMGDSLRHHWLRASIGMAKRSHLDGDSLDQAASVVEKLAVLLEAGVTPLAAWGYLAETTGSSEKAIVDAVAHTPPGASIGNSILDAACSTGESAADRDAWRGLAAAWIVASDAGAPLASSLHDFASSLRSLSETRRGVSEALSGPVATAKFVVVLPFVGILFGAALGFDTIGTLFHSVPGAACLILGVILLLLARSWNGHLIAGAMPRDLTPGLALDLTAIAVSGGGAIGRARSSVATALECCGIEESGDVDSVLDLSRRAGIPAGRLLRSEADRVRRKVRSAANRRAAALSVTLMLPLGVCILPAFLLLGVAPLMIAVLSSTVGTGS